MSGQSGNGMGGPSDPFGSRKRLAKSSRPGAYRRTFLWGFWSIILIAVVTLVDVVLRQAWPALVTPALLCLAAWMLSRTHFHQQAVADLPPADGEASFRHRKAAVKAHERAELVWGLATLAALVAALASPLVLS